MRSHLHWLVNTDVRQQRPLHPPYQVNQEHEHLLTYAWRVLWEVGGGRCWRVGGCWRERKETHAINIKNNKHIG